MVADGIAQSDLASRLRRLRNRLDVTQDDLGSMAGVSRRTIVRWEAGKVVPHAHELQRLLQALSLSSEESRAILWDRQSRASEARQKCSDISGREIRIVRKRLGLTIEEFARRVGSSRSTIARWENRNSLPDAQSVSCVAAFLGTHRSDRLSPVRSSAISAADEGRRVALIRQELSRICTAWYEDGDELLDLHFSELIADIGEHVPDEFERESLLCEARVAFAEFLTDCQRCHDAVVLCKAVRNSHAHYPQLPKRTLHTATLIEARHHMHSSWRTAQRGLKILRRLDHVALDSRLHSARLSIFAECYSQHNQPKKALDYALLAVAAAKSGDQSTIARRQFQLSQVLAAQGRSAEALEAMPELGQCSPIDTIRQCILLARLMEAMGRQCDSDHWREMAQKYIEDRKLKCVALETCG